MPVVERSGAGSRGDVAHRGGGGGRRRGAALVLAAAAPLVPLPGEAAPAAAAGGSTTENGGVAHARREPLAQRRGLAPEQGQRKPDARAVVEAVAALQRLRLLRRRGPRRRRGGGRGGGQDLRQLVVVVVIFGSFLASCSWRKRFPQSCGEAGVSGARRARGHGSEGSGERGGSDFCFFVWRRSFFWSLLALITPLEKKRKKERKKRPLSCGLRGSPASSPLSPPAPFSSPDCGSGLTRQGEWCDCCWCCGVCSC